MIEGTSYRINIGFDTGMGCFTAMVDDFPDVECYGRHPGEVYWQVVDAIEGLIALAEEMGHKHPLPTVPERQT